MTNNKNSIYPKKTLVTAIVLTVITLGLILAAKLAQNQTFLPASAALVPHEKFPSDVTLETFGVTHHVRNISKKACTVPVAGTLNLQNTGYIQFNQPETPESGELHVGAKAKSSLYYYYGPHTGGGGVQSLSTLAGCWEITIGSNNPEYVTITNR